MGCAELHSAALCWSPLQWPVADTLSLQSIDNNEWAAANHTSYCSSLHALACGTWQLRASGLPTAGIVVGTLLVEAAVALPDLGSTCGVQTAEGPQEVEVQQRRKLHTELSGSVAGLQAACSGIQETAAHAAWGSMGRQEQHWKEVTQLAACVAAALQQYWQLPEQLAAAQLELAQAAVTRSCAYLRCPILGGAGGPAAGAGCGGKRCSACRVAW